MRIQNRLRSVTMGVHLVVGCYLGAVEWLFIEILEYEGLMCFQWQENPIATNRLLPSEFQIAFLWITSLIFGCCGLLVPT